MAVQERNVSNGLSRRDFLKRFGVAGGGMAFEVLSRTRLAGALSFLDRLGETVGLEANLSPQEFHLSCEFGGFDMAAWAMTGLRYHPETGRTWEREAIMRTRRGSGPRNTFWGGINGWPAINGIADGDGHLIVNPAVEGGAGYGIHYQGLARAANEVLQPFGIAARARNMTVPEMYNAIAAGHLLSIWFPSGVSAPKGKELVYVDLDGSVVTEPVWYLEHSVLLARAVQTSINGYKFEFLDPLPMGSGARYWASVDGQALAGYRSLVRHQSCFNGAVVEYLPTAEVQAEERREEMEERVRRRLEGEY